MFSNPDLESICLRPGDPFRGTQEALDNLRSSNLTGLADVQQYAKRLLDLHQTVTSRIDGALEEARRRGEAVIDQYSRSPESGDIFGDPMEEYDPVAHKIRVADVTRQVKIKLMYANSEAESIKGRFAKRLKKELDNDCIDVRTFFSYVIFKTSEGIYGIDLEEPDKGIREAVPTIGSTYLLKKQVATIF